MEKFVRIGRSVYNLYELVQADILEETVMLYFTDGRQVELRGEEAVVMARVLDAEDLVEQAREAGEEFNRILSESMI